MFRTLLLTLSVLLPVPLAAEPLAEPPVIGSAGGSLGLLVVAREQRLVGVPGQPVGWVYEICRYRASDGPRRRCPAPGATAAMLSTCPGAEDPPVSPYGGVRLQLSPGDTLRIRLVNCLRAVARDRPFAGEFKHVGEAGDTLLQLNPTNLHTHGLLVEPRCPTASDDTYGDWVFVLAIDPRNRPPADLVGRHSCQSSEPAAGRIGHGRHSIGLDVTPDGVVNYRYRIPRDHPAGLYWIHPHAHGLALNQVAAGLATPLTIGSADYLCGSPGCAGRKGAPRIRHLVLKDAQVMPGGHLKLQEEWVFCGKPGPGDAAPVGEGSCRGSGGPYQGGTWAFTVNGQLDPEIAVATASGEVWRILNASPNVTYWLAVEDAASGVALPVQVLSVDGVSLEILQGSSLAELQAKMGSKIKAVRCPTGGGTGAAREPICAERLLMMPSSRVEIAVAPWTGRATRAVLRNHAYDTGPDGDRWPGIELATITFPELASGAEVKPLPLKGQSHSLVAPGGFFTRTASKGTPSAMRCQQLAPGRARQIVFGTPSASAHGLGYREVQADQPLGPPGDLVVSAFDHAADPTVCVSLAPGNRAVSEVWELVNIAGEDHNFHVHQTRFEVLRAESFAGGSVTPEQLEGARVLHDNVPVPRGGAGCDGTVAAWRSGACLPSRVIVRIPFAILGDFVYHCHILGHEDSGMMAKISVVPARASE
jgi:FtsP/CotA-like multicopper oxidase with cupredoxin domain